MLLTVKGRTVEINDELETRYEKIGMGPITELFALGEISTTYKCLADDILDDLTDEEMVKTIEDAIIGYIEVTGV